MTNTNRCRWLPQALMRLWLVLMLLACADSVFAQGTAATRNFDHTKTGFALTGQHTNERCESCHINGIFKGTPRDCASCHVAGTRWSRNNVVKTQNHVPTQLACDSCHNTRTYTGAQFNHTGVTQGSCASCHNGSTASGKPSNHIATSGSCDSCHKTSAWTPASGFDHSGVSPGTCATCHNGSRATGKAATHVPVGSQSCDACHRTGGSWRPSSFNHTQLVVANQCATCHTGGFPPADGRSTSHIPYQALSGVAIANCDSCHKAGFSAWAPAKFHGSVSVSTQCGTCHTGNYPGAVGKPNTPVHAGQTVCETCHKSTINWSAAKVDHAAFTAATNCSSCHNGSTATGKSGTHVPVGATNCIACHSTSNWKPSSFSHTQVAVTNQCASCHTGNYPPADGRSATHIPYQTLSGVAIANCDSCHKQGYTAWNGAKFHASVAVSTQCAACHTGGFPPAVGKPNTAIHSGVTGNCESCHKSTTSWSAAKVDHSTFTAATNCGSCHNGSTATGKSGTHVPVGATNCFSCHTTTAWKPTKFNHTQVTAANQCASCHTGAYPPADGRTANHIPYQTLSGVSIGNCDSCHKQGYTAWSGARFHSSVTVSTQCVSCHVSSYPDATGTKPNNATHTGVTGNCESCHKSTSSWSSAKVDHSTFTTATNCGTCHNGSAATGKNATHVPVGATNCINCHTTTAWKPTKFNHTQVVVASQCASCHSGAYPPADGRTTNHIPYQTITGVVITNCDSCHKQGYTAWSGARFHGSVTISTQCASCHIASYPDATGTKPNNTTHAGVTGNCESCHKSTASWSTVTFAHSAANAVGTGTCDTCHNGSTAKGKQSGHIPVTTGPTKCDNCHRSQTSFASSVTMNHSVVVATTCKTCHNGSYVSQGATGALAKPTNHIPEATQLLNGASMDCKACHTSTSSWGSMTMNHNGSQGNGAGWCKGCHQSGVSYLGSMERMQLNHRNRTPAPTDCSQSGCHRPLGSTGTTYRNWD